jgi:curved DNA-binding protein CbpA
MKDYYKILGVDEEASGEEIRDRWVELTKCYHPDRNQGSDDEEKIKEINEAYEVLKDLSKRLDYDLERALKKSIIKKAYHRRGEKSHIQKILFPLGILAFVIIVGLVIFRWSHVVEPPQSEAPYEIDKILEKKNALSIPPVKTELEAKIEKEVPKEIQEVVPQENAKIDSVPLQYVPSVREREPGKGEEYEKKISTKSEVPPPSSLTPVEKESKPKEELAPQIAMKTEMPVKVEVPKEVPKVLPKEVSKEVPKEIPKETPKEISKEVIKEVPKEVSREALKEVPKEVPKEVTKGVPKEVIKEIPKEVPREIPKEVPKETPKEVPKETAKVITQESAKIDKPKPIVTEPPPVPKMEELVKAEKVASLPPPLLAKEGEVRQFFADYVGRYIRKDVKGFISLFSPKAIQNQKDGFDEIQKIYTNFFDKSQDLQYHMEDTKIEIYQNRVEVKARFKVNQTIKKGGGEKIWKGNIRWILVKEDGILKVITLDYQNEKSP